IGRRAGIGGEVARLAHRQASYFPSSTLTGPQSGPGGWAMYALALFRNAAEAGSASAKRANHSAAPAKSRARQRARPSAYPAAIANWSGVAPPVGASGSNTLTG